MQELVIGTSNPAKKQMIRSALLPLGLVVRGADDYCIVLEVEEDGATAQANARKKSLAYAKALGRPVLSMDNALYLRGLADAEQPGIHTGRIGGQPRRATDQELLAHYAALIERLGGRIDGHWEFAVCFATEDRQVFEKTIISSRTFVGKPSRMMIPGYPLESLQIEPEGGKYISEMTSEEQDAFWQRIVGKELCLFVRGLP
ncbi:MAG: non-canonical purine NTP pyrophosphatase, partial [Roseiflexaceae bacterium]